jgi:hypothetical protein
MKGYVALTTVLVIIPLLLLTGVDSVYKNLTTLITGRMNYDYQILKTNTESCLEEAIYKTKRSSNYTGEFSLGNGSWSCIVTVSNDTTPGIKIISIESSDTNNIRFSIIKSLNTNVNPFEVSTI